MIASLKSIKEIEGTSDNESYAINVLQVWSNKTKIYEKILTSSIQSWHIDDENKFFVFQEDSNASKINIVRN